MKSHKGFTLVELLVSAVILFTLLALAMFGYQLFTLQWSKDNQRSELAYQQLRNYELFSSAMQGIIPYVVRDKDSIGFYFLGREQGFTAVTQTPIFTTDAPAVIRVFREANTEGGFRLVYEEASLRLQPLVEAEQNLPFSHRMVLVPQLESIGFSYFRQKLGDVQLTEQGDVIREFEWVKTHDGLITKSHPNQLELNLAGFAWYFSVPEREAVMKSRYSIQGEVN